MNIANNKRRKASQNKIEKVFLKLIQKKNIDEISVSTTYFKLESISITPVNVYNIDLAEKYYKNKHIDYHIEFFRAGLNAIIKKWLNSGCKESPEEMANIIQAEYTNKN